VTRPHDSPTAAELVQAVREFLEHDVLSVTDGRVQFHVRVAANVLGMVEREMVEGVAQAARHEIGLAALGVADDAELASAIREGRLDHRLPEVAAFVRATVRDKLLVANPTYLNG
jgi:hypothetical protein